jgi:hypothetical protein
MQFLLEWRRLTRHLARECTGIDGLKTQLAGLTNAVQKRSEENQSILGILKAAFTRAKE